MNAEDHSRLVARLKVEERFVAHVYKDARGFDTIGYGTLIDARRGGGITETEATYLMANRLGETDARLADFDWYNTQDSVRQAALSDMAFNLGVDGLLHFPHFLGFMAKHDYANAISELIGTPWHAQVGIRADRIIELIRTGAWQ